MINQMKSLLFLSNIYHFLNQNTELIKITSGFQVKEVRLASVQDLAYSAQLGSAHRLVAGLNLDPPLEGDLGQAEGHLEEVSWLLRPRAWHLKNLGLQLGLLKSKI